MSPMIRSKHREARACTFAGDDIRNHEQHSDYKPVPFDTREGSIGWHGNALLVRKPVEHLPGDQRHLRAVEPKHE